MKKPTYKEKLNLSLRSGILFEKELKIFWTIGSILILIICLELLFKIGSLKSENDQLKAQNYKMGEYCGFAPSWNYTLSIYEPDYHSSGKLFCEHYNGTYKEYITENLCSFIINDTRKYCDVTMENNKFVFIKDCEAVK